MPRQPREIKPDYCYHWGSNFLPKVIKHKGKKTSPGQMRLPWVEWEFEDLPVREVAEQSVGLAIEELEILRVRVLSELKLGKQATGYKTA
ncbi:hypothetical protein [Nostoc sp. UHCC 0251]|uniref:hypothetical protein n=1 Tax=Nostoc sp. UHCC 0251 TaxID=3110240 RepID=UPI002B1F37E8|nr:hypothetical protein [Nostoc sp. UHCC 0251]MEA5625783.1 hypothetical protein [Nostoc sp. UHCC 0251]